ncbi:hypothetical protein T484DRAFT_2531679 [Baffinella frigidus]|nr:hypothetical protein T484DRAFT_2531679 [Cryptophyta sp. CCMP2293]
MTLRPVCCHATSLLLAVIAVGVRAAPVAVVDVARGRHVELWGERKSEQGPGVSRPIDCCVLPVAREVKTRPGVPTQMDVPFLPAASMWRGCCIWRDNRASRYLHHRIRFYFECMSQVHKCIPSRRTSCISVSFEDARTMRTLVRGPRGPGGALATTNRRTNALCLKGHVRGHSQCR